MRKILSAMLSLVMAVSIVGCSKKSDEAVDTAAQSTKVKVMSTKPREEQIVKKNTFSGKIVPEQSVEVYPNASERVIKTYANVGDYVNAGDLLFEVRALHTENKVETAKAELEAAKANAKKMIGSTTDNTISGVEQGRDTLENALKQMKDGLSSLEESVSAAKKSYRSLQAEADAEPENEGKAMAAQAAQKQYEALKAQLSSMEDSYDDQVKQIEDQMDISNEMADIAQNDIKNSMSSMADALVEMQEKIYNNAQKELDDTKVYAPISGTIKAKNVTENNMVANTMVAYEIFTSKNISVEFGVSEQNISKMAVGDEIEVDFKSKSYIGNITKIPMMADSATGLFSVEASVKDASDELLSGAVVQVKAPIEKEESALTVPISCVYFEGDDVYLYVNKDGIAKKTEITTGISNNKDIQVLSGITGAEEIITTWHPNLADGVETQVMQSSGLTEYEREQKNNAIFETDDEQASDDAEKIENAEEENNTEATTNEEGVDKANETK